MIVFFSIVDSNPKPQFTDEEVRKGKHLSFNADSPNTTITSPPSTHLNKSSSIKEEKPSTTSTSEGEAEAKETPPKVGSTWSDDEDSVEVESDMDPELVDKV